MTQKSLVPKAALQAGYSFSELVKLILVDAFGKSVIDNAIGNEHFAGRAKEGNDD